MKTKIVVDSSANLYALSGVDFVCVPLKIVTDDGEYLDTAELDAVGMAQTLRSYKGKTGTSCPTLKDASLLSSVTMLGVARMSFLLLLASAVSSTPQSPLKKPAAMPL
jgi:fatty acid-binding protein DegV